MPSNSIPDIDFQNNNSELRTNNNTNIDKILKKQKLPNFRKNLSSKDIYGGYKKLLGSNFLKLVTIGAGVIIAIFSFQCILFIIQNWDVLYERIGFLTECCHKAMKNFSNLIFIALLCNIAIICSLIMYLKLHPDVYLVDFCVQKGKENLKASHESFINKLKLENLGKEEIEFQSKILSNSKIGDASYLPKSMMSGKHQFTIEAARKEAEMVMFDCVQEILDKTKITVNKIDFLIVNCSLFCPTPSLSSMIVNHFKFPSKIKTFNLGGMGCSAGLISIDLAKDLLRLHKNSYALVVSTENITLNFYRGKEKSMMIPNTIFRVGAAAILLSSCSKERKRAKMKLIHLIRTHKGSDSECYNSIQHCEDQEGFKGVRLSKKIMEVAGTALQSNISVLGPLTLPYIEQFKYFANLIARKLLLQNFSENITHKSFLLKYLHCFGKYILDLPIQNIDTDGVSFLTPVNKIKLLIRRICSLPLIKTQNKYNNINTHEFEKDKICLTKKELIGKPFIPDFTKAFDHFCIHAGGRSVIDAMEKNLKIPEEKMRASRQVLHKYGNTSSSSIQYEMEQHINNSNVFKNQKIWQIAFGSGFKCNSAVQKTLRNLSKNM